MRILSIRSSVARTTLAVMLSSAASAFAANTHVVVAHPNLTWTYGGKTSSQTQPLQVDDLQVGDIIDIQVPQAPHGFITINKTATGQTETKDPVLACDETATSKPNAVLREIQCGPGPTSNFGKSFKGSLKLEVLPTFKNPVDFYCVVHKAVMPGTLKLKPAAAPAKVPQKKQ